MKECYPGVMDFYLDRIRFAMGGNFKQREEMLYLINRCAFNDDMLTDHEYTIILNNVVECHNKALEDNYNDGWNQ